MEIVRVTFVPGHPRPKGSMDPQHVRDGAGRLTGGMRLVESSKDGPRWRRIVAQHVRALGWPIIAEGPVCVAMTFWFPPPKGEHGRYAIGGEIGDLDKLVRNVLDALGVDKTGKGNGAGVYSDDRQVAYLHEPLKYYALPAERIGLGLRVWPL